MIKDGKPDSEARHPCRSDANARLQDGLRLLALSYPELTQEQYRQRLLALFNEAGIAMTARELEMLLLLRQRAERVSGADQKDGNPGGKNGET